MGLKPEDVRIPYDWYYYGEELKDPTPKMYDQQYVDNLKMEIEYYKNKYRDLLIEKTRRTSEPEQQRHSRPLYPPR